MDFVLPRAEGIAGLGFGKTRDRDNVAGHGFIDGFLAVGVHAEQAANALFFLLGGVPDRGAGGHGA